MDELEKILAEHARIRAPFDKRWKRLAAEFCAEHLGEILMFRALGLQAVTDPERRKLILQRLGDPEGHDHEDYGFNVWLMEKCIGDRLITDHDVFARCMGCYRVRTQRSIGEGPCKCGSMRINNAVGNLETQAILGAVALGY